MNPSSSSASVSSSKKSTNVRAYPWGARALFAGLRAVEAASVPLAARLGAHVMFQTTRRHPSTWERGVMAEGRRFDVASKGGRIAAWTFGEGPLVVLVHGWNGRGGQLGAFIAPLVEKGFRVVAFDAPGHGESEGSSASLPEFADALDAVLDEARGPFESAHAIVAHSMGGAAVTLAMSRFRDDPRKSLERSLREVGLPAKRFAFVAPPVDVRDFVRGFARLVGFAKETQEALSRRIEARFAMSFEDLYAPSHARRMSAPLLVVHDEDDAEVPLQCGRLLADAWPGAKLEVTHGLGHTRILRDPTVISRIVDFVTG